MGRALILASLATLLYAGCLPRRPVYIPVKTTEVRTFRLRDTLIKTVLVPYRDSVSIPDTSSFLSNPYAESRAVWASGRLSHTLNIKPDTLPVPIKLETVEITQTVEIPVEVERKLTRWERLKMDFGGWAMGVVSCLILFAVIFIVYKIRGKRLFI